MYNGDKRKHVHDLEEFFDICHEYWLKEHELENMRNKCFYVVLNGEYLDIPLDMNILDECIEFRKREDLVYYGEYQKDYVRLRKHYERFSK